MSYRRQASSSATLSPSSSTTPRRRVGGYDTHPKYYIEGADLYLVAENVVFRVHGYFFSRESPIFHRRMNPSSPGDMREGSSEDDPVFLDDSADDFEQLIWVFYNPRYSIYEGTTTQWKVILRLADKYNFHEVKDLAVREMHKKLELSVIEKMALYHQYRVPEKYLIPLYAELIEREQQLTLEEGEALGARAVVLVSGMRETFRVNTLLKKLEVTRAKDIMAHEAIEREDPQASEGPSTAGLLSGAVNVLDGVTRDDIILALEEQIGIEAGTSVVLEEPENTSQEPPSSLPSTPSRRHSTGPPSRASPHPRRKGEDISKGYIFID